MWSGQDSVEPQPLWGNPGHSQNAWTNGGSNQSMNYPSRPQQWPSPQMAMQAPWNYQQQPQQPTQWPMPPQQQMGWPSAPNTGYGGYEEKKVPNNRGYSGYGYGVMPPSMAPQPQQQPQAWQGQRDVYQRQQWDGSSRGAPNPSGGAWPTGGAAGGSSQWQNDWQNVRETEGLGNSSPGINPTMAFDAWPGAGGEEANIMWRDPKPKKKIRDTGVQAWGDPSTQMDKILRWKEADHEEFQKGPSASTWNQLLFGLLNVSSSPVVEGNNPWAEQADSSWPANVWESSEAVLAEDNEPRALNFSEDAIRGYSGTKADFANAGGDMNDPNIFALNNAFQRALLTGLIPKDLNTNKQHLDQKMKLMVNNLLQKMVKEEQAENELEHIRQLMARGDFPVTVAQEHERINAERDVFKAEIHILSNEIKEAVQGSSWLHVWKNRNTGSGDAPDVLAAALHSMGIEETPKMPNPAPWQDGSSLPWSEPAPISINTDLDRPSRIDEAGSLDRKVIGPQEFVPGRKWEWHDPAKVAEDPNATPGSVKPSFASPNWGNGACDPWIEKPAEKKSSGSEENSEK